MFKKKKLVRESNDFIKTHSIIYSICGFVPSLNPTTYSTQNLLALQGSIST